MARWSLILVSLLAVGGGYGYLRIQSLDEPLGHGDKSISVNVKPGMRFDQVVQLLEDAEAIRDPLVFSLYARYTKADRGIKAGEYFVDLGWTPKKLLKALREGSLPKQIRVTIPEGFNRWQVADRLSKRGLVDRARFLRRVEREGLEGRLFPETYLFRSDAETDDVINRLLAQFNREIKVILAGRPIDDLDRLINLASLVEKESKHPEDQKKVARVFANRIALGMKLQTDPTCIYGESTYRMKPHPRNCRDPKSRYSTYVIKGLPPTAIANPGRTAIAAVLAPYDGPDAEDLIFFVAKRDGSGTHYFSKTLDQHRRAINKYLRKRK